MRARALALLSVLTLRLSSCGALETDDQALGVTATCATTNVAQGKPAAASSTENGGTPALAAFDGNTSTRWSSAFRDPQWLQVDLGSSQQICGVVVQWKAAYGKAFEIQVSDRTSNKVICYPLTDRSI